MGCCENIVYITGIGVKSSTTRQYQHYWLSKQRQFVFNHKMLLSSCVFCRPDISVHINKTHSANVCNISCKDYSNATFIRQHNNAAILSVV